MRTSVATLYCIIHQAPNISRRWHIIQHCIHHTRRVTRTGLALVLRLHLHRLHPPTPPRQPSPRQPSPLPPPLLHPRWKQVEEQRWTFWPVTLLVSERVREWESEWEYTHNIGFSSLHLATCTFLYPFVLFCGGMAFYLMHMHPPWLYLHSQSTYNNHFLLKHLSRSQSLRWVESRSFPPVLSLHYILPPPNLVHLATQSWPISIWYRVIIMILHCYPSCVSSVAFKFASLH